MKPERSPDSRNRRLLWGTGAAVAACLLSGCIIVAGLGRGVWSGIANSDDPLFSPGRTNLTSAQIEGRARITLPPSARNVRAYDQSFMDTIIFVRFEMAPADLPQFLAGTQVSLPLSHTVNPFGGQSLGPNTALAWWTPQGAQRFEAGTASVETGAPGSSHGLSQTILIDTTDAQTYIVYVRTLHLA